MGRLVDILGGIVRFRVQLVHCVWRLHHRNALQDGWFQSRLVLLLVHIALLKVRRRYHFLLQINRINVPFLQLAVPREVRRAHHVVMT